MSLTSTQEAGLVAHIAGVSGVPAYGSGTQVHVTEAQQQGLSSTDPRQTPLSATNPVVTANNTGLLTESERAGITHAIGAGPTDPISANNPLLANNVPVAVPALAVLQKPAVAGIQFLVINESGVLPVGFDAATSIAVIAPKLKTLQPEIYVGAQGIHTGISSAYSYFGLETQYGEAVVNQTLHTAIIVTNVFWNTIGNVLDPSALLLSAVTENGFLRLGDTDSLILALNVPMMTQAQSLCVRMNAHGSMENIAALWNALNQPSYPSPTVYRNIKQPFVSSAIGDFTELFIGTAPHQLHFEFEDLGSNRVAAHIAMYNPDDTTGDMTTASQVILDSAGNVALQGRGSASVTGHTDLVLRATTGTGLLRSNNTMTVQSEDGILQFLAGTAGIDGSTTGDIVLHAVSGPYDTYLKLKAGGDASLYGTGNVNITAHFGAVVIDAAAAYMATIGTAGHHTTMKITPSANEQFAIVTQHLQNVGETPTKTVWNQTSWGRLILYPQNTGNYDNCLPTYALNDGSAGFGVMNNIEWYSSGARRTYSLPAPVFLQNSTGGKSRFIVACETDDTNTADYGNPALMSTRYSLNSAAVTNAGPDIQSVYASTWNADVEAELHLGAMIFNGANNSDFVSGSHSKLMLSTSDVAYTFASSTMRALFPGVGAAAAFTSSLSIQGDALIEGNIYTNGMRKQTSRILVDYADESTDTVDLLYGYDNTGYQGGDDHTGYHVIAGIGLYGYDSQGGLRWHHHSANALAGSRNAYGYGIHVNNGIEGALVRSAAFGSTDIWLLPEPFPVAGTTRGASLRVGPSDYGFQFSIFKTTALADPAIVTTRPKNGTHPHLLFAPDYTSKQRLWIGAGSYDILTNTYNADELHSIRVDANGVIYLPSQAHGEVMLGFGTQADGYSGTHGAMTFVDNIPEGYGNWPGHGDPFPGVRWVCGQGSPFMSGGVMPVPTGLYIYEGNGVGAIGTDAEIYFHNKALLRARDDEAAMPTGALDVEVVVDGGTQQVASFVPRGMEVLNVDDFGRNVTTEAQMPQTGNPDAYEGFYNLNIDTARGKLHQAVRYTPGRGMEALIEKPISTLTAISVESASIESITWCWKHNRYYRVNNKAIGTIVEMSYDGQQWSEAYQVHDTPMISPKIVSANGIPLLVGHVGGMIEFYASVRPLYWFSATTSIAGVSVAFGKPNLVAHEYFDGNGTVAVYYFKPALFPDAYLIWALSINEDTEVISLTLRGVNADAPGMYITTAHREGFQTHRGFWQVRCSTVYNAWHVEEVDYDVGVTPTTTGFLTDRTGTLLGTIGASPSSVSSISLRHLGGKNFVYAYKTFGLGNVVSVIAGDIQNPGDGTINVQCSLAVPFGVAVDTVDTGNIRGGGPYALGMLVDKTSRTTTLILHAEYNPDANSDYSQVFKTVDISLPHIKSSGVTAQMNQMREFILKSPRIWCATGSWGDTQLWGEVNARCTYNRLQSKICAVSPMNKDDIATPIFGCGTVAFN